MINSDLVLLTLMSITGVNMLRYFTTLRSLLYIMREVHPLLYQQVDGNGFFTPSGNVSKQVRLFYYIKSKEYHHHHDERFTTKCERVRELFILSSMLTGVTLLAAILL